MGDLIRLVDTISSSPMVRLDLNDETSWWVKSFDAPPPRLRRSMAANAMRDGIAVGSTTYDARTLVIELECRKSTQDLAATELQKLARELDRADNWLMYQPNGLTKPVFFRTFRSDASQLEDVIAQAAMRTFTIELLAEPFAFGLPETIDAGSNYANASTVEATPLSRTLTATVGDVASPLLLWSTTDDITHDLMLVAGVGSTVVLEAEGLSNSTDTTSVSSDATYSNSAGKSVSFATQTAMVARTNTTLVTVPPGTYQLVGRFKKSSASAVIVPAIGVGSDNRLPLEAMESTTEFQVLRFGTVTVDQSIGMKGNVATQVAVNFKAQRVSGTGTLGIDFLAFVPCSTTAIVSPPVTTSTLVLDGYADEIYPLALGTSPMDASASRAIGFVSATAVGALPSIQPTATNTLAVIRLGGCAKTVTTNIAASYWPRYLRVRPAST